jgi:hypothetical protein
MKKKAVCCVRPPLLQKPPSSPRSSKSASNSSAESAASHTASRMDKEKGCSCSQIHRDLASSIACRALFLLGSYQLTNTSYVNSNIVPLHPHLALRNYQLAHSSYKNSLAVRCIF